MVEIQGKKFICLLAKANIENRIAALGKKIQQDYEGKKPLFVVVLNGAFIFAADLIRACDAMPCEMTFVRLSSYLGMTSSGEVSTLLGLKEDLKGRHLIIVEDIIDTGKTLHHFTHHLQHLEPASIAVATFLMKPDALVYPIKADYCAFEIENRFVIGYGLDFDEQGRGLADLYQLADG